MRTNREHMETQHKAGTSPAANTEAAVLQQQIASLAYLKAEARGFLPGHELDDWLEAELEINDSIPQAEKH